MSSPVCELLKRSDENAVVIHAHKNPMFVEDCVRNIRFRRSFKNIPHLT